MNFLIRRHLLFNEQTLYGRSSDRPVALANVVLIKSSRQPAEAGAKQ